MQNSLFAEDPNDPALGLKAAFLLIDQRMRDAIIIAARQEDAPHLRLPPVPAGRVYLIRSCLQKALRRGQVAIALRMAFALQQQDDEALYRRLSVIALEDIGLANLPLVNQLLWVQGKHAWRREVGDRRILHYFIRAMNASIKDRSASDIKVLYHRDPALAASRRLFAHLTDGELAGILSETQRSLAERAMAAHYLAGVRDGEYANLVARPGNLAYLIDTYHAAGVPVEVLYAIRRGATAQQEGMHMALGLLWLLRGGMEHSAQPDPLLTLPRVGPYLSASMDIHTREGLAANVDTIRRTPWLGWQLLALAPGRAPTEVLGACLFRMEGAQVHQRLKYPPGVNILMTAAQLHLAAHGLSLQHQEAATDAVSGHLERLAEARLRQYQQGVA